MKFRTTMILAAALLSAPAAMAQTDQTSPAPATSPDAAPAQSGTTGAGTAATAVTDAEVSQFATAALAAAKVRSDASIPDTDKNAKMVEAITATGLPATRFNEIAQAMQSDTALNKKIQEAAAKQQPAAATPK